MSLTKRELNDILNKIRLEYHITDLQQYKDDWKMCDKVCDQKELKIRELSKLAKEVVKNEYEFDDELAIAITNLRNYLDKQVATKIRANMSTEDEED